MKHLIKYFALVAAGAALVLSCSKEKDINTPEEITPVTPKDEQGKPDLSDYDPSVYLLSFGATFEDNSETKVEITFDEENKKANLEFEVGDKVLVYSGEKTGTYSYDGNVFTPEAEKDVVPISSGATVYYPASEFSLDIEDGIIKFEMPDAIEAGSTEDLGDKTPMAGIIPSNINPTVTFKNLGSILRVRFNSDATDGETITAVELNVTGANITGKADVNWSGETLDATPSVAGLDGTTSISIETTDGHLTNSAFKEFYFFLPASGTLTGMTLKAVYGKEGGYAPYEAVSRKSEMDLIRNQIYIVQGALKGFFGGGDGSATYPYIIASKDHFDKIYTYWNDTNEGGNLGYNTTSTDTFFGHANYRQTAENIDKGGDAYKVIGTSEKPFYGVYDGGNKKISNVHIGNGNNQGLFGYTSSATIKNWRAENISISGTGNFRGAFIGQMAGGEVNNCDVIGGESTISGDNAVGGIVGIVADKASIISCDNNATVTGKQGTGGIAGFIATDNTSGGATVNASLSSCTNTGSVSGTNRVGGIVGSYNTSNNMSNCTNEGPISGSAHNVGGLIGYKRSGHIYSGCVNTGDVTGLYNVGGLVGYQSGGAIQHNGENKTYNSGSITATGKDANGYTATGGIVGWLAGGSIGNTNTLENSGTISVTTGGNGIGGIVGTMANGTVSTCTNTQAISVSQSAAGIGGIVGYMNNGTVKGCYYNGSTITGNTNTETGDYAKDYGIGGIVGTVTGGTVADCYTGQDVTIAGWCKVGGVVGSLQTTSGNALVINCAAKAKVISHANTSSGGIGFAGGIVGMMTSSNSNKAIVANCVALAAQIYATNWDNPACGGIVGRISGTKTTSILDNCYAQAAANYIGYMDGSTIVTKNNTGGIYGRVDAGTVADCYYMSTAGSGAIANKDNYATYGNGMKVINNNQKNGIAVITGISTVAELDSNGELQNHSFGGNVSGYLDGIMNFGAAKFTAAASYSDYRSFSSSSSTEKCSKWVGRNGDGHSSYNPAIPKVLYDKGANYMPR